MKFFNYKRYKFSTIFKDIGFRRYNFKIFLKYLDLKLYKFFKISEYINLKSINYTKFYKYIDPRRYNYSKFYKYINPRRYNYPRFYNLNKFKSYRYIKISVPILILSSIFIYLSIPIFYEFNKSNIEKLICKDLNVICSIDKKIKYNIFPSPRIKLSNFVARSGSDNNKILAKIEDVEIKISLKNLHNSKALNYTKINLKNGEIVFDLKNLKKYKNILQTKFNLKNINFKKLDIKFLDDKKDITSIDNAVFKYKSDNSIDKINISGNFLTDKIVINLKNKRNEAETSSILKIKLSNSKLFSKLEISNKKAEGNLTKGNFSIKKNKNRAMAIFEYKDDKIIVKKGNLKNTFLDGKFTGILKILPYFNFNLDIDLNTLNFNQLYNALVNLDDEARKKLFKINNKINGELILSANKIYSRNSLFNSFESRTKFMNGNIFVEQMLLSLGKLGAADLTGVIIYENEFANFKFEKNLFIDNLRKFYNKFGIYNKKLQNQGSIHVLGNFDLMNLNMRFNEIVSSEKVSDENLAYYEKEFNNIFLENGYKSFFRFANLKQFVQLVAEE